MYCENCGRELAENSTTCMNCGTTSTFKEKRSGKKGVIAIVIGIIAIIVIALLSVRAFSVNASPEKVVEARVVAYYEADTEKYIKCYADYWVEDLADDLGMSRSSSRKEIANGLASYWRFAKSKKVTVKSCEEIERYKKGEYTFYYREAGLSDADYETVTEIARVRICYKVEGERSQEEIYTCVKISGKWYVV